MSYEIIGALALTVAASCITIMSARNVVNAWHRGQPVLLTVFVALSIIVLWICVIGAWLTIAINLEPVSRPTPRASRVEIPVPPMPNHEIVPENRIADSWVRVCTDPGESETGVFNCGVKSSVYPAPDECWRVYHQEDNPPGCKSWRTTSKDYPCEIVCTDE